MSFELLKTSQTFSFLSSCIYNQYICHDFLKFESVQITFLLFGLYNVLYKTQKVFCVFPDDWCVQHNWLVITSGTYSLSQATY